MIQGFVVWALSKLAGWGFKDIVNKTVDFIRKSNDNELAGKKLASDERVATKTLETEVLVSQIQAHVSMYNAATSIAIERQKHQFASPLFFGIVIVFLGPLAFYWGFLCLNNIFWCKDCMFPQPWVIAAFPEQSVVWANTMMQWIFGPLAVGTSVGLAVRMARR